MELRMPLTPSFWIMSTTVKPNPGAPHGGLLAVVAGASAPQNSLKKAARQTRRLATIVLGCALIVAGLVLIPLPGPFTLGLVFLGLTVLSWELRWAKEMLAKLRLVLEELISRRRRAG
jgi:hypothetical protein